MKKVVAVRGKMPGVGDEVLPNGDGKQRRDEEEVTGDGVQEAVVDRRRTWGRSHRKSWRE